MNEANMFSISVHLNLQLHMTEHNLVARSIALLMLSK